MTGAALSRILADAGYKGHNAPEKHRFKVYTQGQKRGITAAIRRQFKRRDAINATLAAAGYNFRRLLAWLALVLRLLLKAFMHEPAPQSA